MSVRYSMVSYGLKMNKLIQSSLSLGHLLELDRLQNENRQLSTIVSSLEPFVRSLNSVSKRLSPM